MIDRDQLREATEQWGPRPKPSGFGLSDNQALLILEAARLVADPDTLTITKVDGEWPKGVLKSLFDVLRPNGSMPDYIGTKQISDALDALLEGQHEPR